MIVKIGSIVSIEDAPGNQGPQKRIVFKDESRKFISGWIPIQQFKASDWVDGNTVDVEIYKSGKYTNFKMPSQSSAGTPTASAAPAAEVMAALKEIYREVRELRRLVENPLPHIESAPPPYPPWEKEEPVI